MAKSKSATVNKSQAIRDALEAHPDKSPSEIAEALKAKGLDVSAQYVSTIKSNAKVKGRKRRVVKRRRPGRIVAGNGSADHIMKAGLHFVVLAGGIEAARERLVGLQELIEAAKEVD
jgi:hypothetical protein